MGTGVMLGVTLRWTSIPSRGEYKNTPSRFMLLKPEISAGLMSLLARKAETLPLPFSGVPLPKLFGFLKAREFKVSSTFHLCP